MSAPIGQRGTIVDILPLRPSKTFNTGYYRVSFVMEDQTWAHTDICPAMKNYDHWKPLMEPGTMLEGLMYLDKSKGKIDADWKPNKIGMQSVWQAMNRENGNQLELF